MQNYTTLGKSAGVCYKHFFQDQFSELKKILHRNSNPFVWNMFTTTVNQSNDVDIPTDFDSQNLVSNDTTPLLTTNSMDVVLEINQEPTFALEDLKKFLKENPSREAWSWMINSDHIY